MDVFGPVKRLVSALPGTGKNSSAIASPHEASHRQPPALLARGPRRLPLDVAGGAVTIARLSSPPPRSPFAKTSHRSKPRRAPGANPPRNLSPTPTAPPITA